MNNRPNVTSHQSRRRQQHQSTSITPTPSLSRTSSRPETPPRSRGDLVSRRSSSSALRHYSAHPMPDPPVTPTPKKPDRRKRGGVLSSVQRNQPRDDAGPAPSDQDEDMLFDLLGVASPRPTDEDDHSDLGGFPVSENPRERQRGPGSREAIAKGKLVTKGRRAAESEPEGIDQARTDMLRKDARPGRSLPLRPQGAPKFEERDVMSEGDSRRPRAQKDRRRMRDGTREDSSRRAKLAPLTPTVPTVPSKPSGISGSRPRTGTSPSLLIESTPSADIIGGYDLSSLSRSLPTQGFLVPVPLPAGPTRRSKKGGGSEDESAVWDMPDGVGPSTEQELTWQQKLQNDSGEYVSRNTKSNPTERKAKTRSITHGLPTNPSSFVVRPIQPRRLSLDAIPASRPSSTFDTTLPYHTGLNTNRAPQTPAKLSTSRAPNSSLPIVGTGKFPRVNHTSKGPVGALIPGAGPKYAGPTFHNSPHAASLPKPDLEDF